MKRPAILVPLLAPLVLLLVPLGAMQFPASGVQWGPLDFLVAWILLAGTGLAWHRVGRPVRPPAYRAGAGLALLTALLLVWVNLAVGLVGAEGSPVSLMYFAVPLVGLVGAVHARLHAAGMARALHATAAAQAAAGVIAFLVWPDDVPLVVAAAHAVFIGLFLASAWLFQRAAGPDRPREDHATA